MMLIQYAKARIKPVAKHFAHHGLHARTIYKMQAATGSKANTRGVMTIAAAQ
jgi:hypothetical protein